MPPAPVGAQGKSRRRHAPVITGILFTSWWGPDDSGIILATLMTLFLYRLHELIKLPELLICLHASAII